MPSESDPNISTSCRQLCDLDEYSLEHVFLFLGVADLDRCVLVCKKFQHIIQRFVFPKKCMRALVGGSPCGTALSLYAFTHRKRVKLDENWRYGRYETWSYFKHYEVYISQLVIDRDWLYITHRGRLQAHRRTKNREMLDTSSHWVMGNDRDSDITSLVKMGDHFLMGRKNGQIVLYDPTTTRSYSQTVTNDIIKAVDFNTNIYAVTTINDSTYILNRSPLELEQLSLRSEEMLTQSFVYPQAYETIKLNRNHLAAGKFHCSKKQALQLIDLYSCTTIQLNSPSTAVYDVLWMDEHCILSGNYNSMRLVDTRTGGDEACWTDPDDASVYCLCYNGKYAVHCGMNYHLRSNLYDLRVPNRCVQMYFPSKNHYHYSPVHRIAADCSQLFLITDHHLRILNFDADRAATKDYSAIKGIWRELIQQRINLFG